RHYPLLSTHTQTTVANQQQTQTIASPFSSKTPSPIVIITPARKPQPPSPYSKPPRFSHRLPSLLPSNHHASSISSPNHHKPLHSKHPLHPNSPNQSPKTAPPPTTKDSSGSNERGKDSRTKRP
ncbi:hypothetical protein NC651_026084, partial [Populus alba x Populus x berolinensis]